MRRQDQWLLLADRLEYHRSDVVAVCVFLNMKRRPAWIAKALALPLDMVTAIATAAKPLLRHRRAWADMHGRIGVGDVERAEQARYILTIESRIDGAGGH